MFAALSFAFLVCAIATMVLTMVLLSAEDKLNVKNIRVTFRVMHQEAWKFFQ